MASGGSARLTSSMEDYLEAIVTLKREGGTARVSDISRVMDVKKPSVTGALSVLVDRGLIVHEKYGRVELTGKGEKIAGEIREKHDMLVGFLHKVLGLDRDLSEKDACGMEHSISQKTFERLTAFLRGLEPGKIKKRGK